MEFKISIAELKFPDAIWFSAFNNKSELFEKQIEDIEKKIKKTKNIFTDFIKFP
jgi:hypothetical protein